jgi:hypothetical protein
MGGAEPNSARPFFEHAGRIQSRLQIRVANKRATALIGPDQRAGSRDQAPQLRGDAPPSVAKCCVGD